MNTHWADRQRHHALAGEALRAGRYREAAFHTARVAHYSLQLAGESKGPVGRAYLLDAQELRRMAGRIEARAGRDIPPLPAGEPQVAEERTDDGSEWLLEERPDVRLDDVAGLQEVKAWLRDNVIWPRLHPETYARYRKKLEAGVLMYGPPGNGKTYIARAVAGELDAAFFSVNAATLKSKWVGKSEKNVKRLFEAAGRHERAIIFVDECDAVLAAGHNEKVNIFNQFLTELDGIGTRREKVFNRFVLAATNKPWLLGNAVLRPGRLGAHVYVGLPDQQSRLAILSGALRDVPVEDPLPLEQLATLLEGRSGADLAWIVERAKDTAIEREVLGGADDRVTLRDVEQAIERTPASVSSGDVERFVRWNATGLDQID